MPNSGHLKNHSIQVPVSVILPSYNRLKFLPKAIESVLQQTHTQWELIIVDDGSTDGTEEWLKRYIHNHPMENKIRFIKTKNHGVSAARNLGVRSSHHPWVAFLDSDDQWLPQKLEKQVPLTTKYNLIHGEEIWIRNEVRVNPKKKHKKYGGRIFTQCLPLCCISPSTVLLNKSIYTDFGGFREDYPVCEDYDLWLKICAHYEVGFVNDPIIIKWGGHTDQLSRKYVAMDSWRVQSLYELRDSPHITSDERSALIEILIKKIHILIKGYDKHGHSKKTQLMNQLLQSLKENRNEKSS